MSHTAVPRRVIISGGGTGGHIFPAISIADTLKRLYPEVEILFVGAEGRMEMQRVPAAGYRIMGLPVEGFHRRQLWKNIAVIGKFLRALSMARDIVRDFAPDVVVGVGGYASAPTLKAAQSLGIPTLIQEQNSYAGVSNKLLARRADRICVAYPGMERFFAKDKIVLTGNPIRPQIEYLQATRQEALAYFGFPEATERIALVVGGSLGARTINESVKTRLAEWEGSGVALIWQTGRLYEQEAKQALEGYTGLCHCAAFIDRMDYAYLLADVVVSRAGACSISELCLLGKPSILVPSPNVAEDHQTKNAQALSSVGAAILIPDMDALVRLTPTALNLLEDTEQRESLRVEILSLAQTRASERIVEEIVKLCKR